MIKMGVTLTGSQRKPHKSQNLGLGGNAHEATPKIRVVHYRVKQAAT